MTLTHATGGWLWVALAIVLIVGCAVIAVVTQIPHGFRRALMVFLVFVSGLFYALEFFLPTHAVTQPNGKVDQQNFLTQIIPDYITPFSSALAAFLLGLGLFSLVRIHGNNVLRKRQGWSYSMALIVAAFMMLIFGFWSKVGTSLLLERNLRDPAALAAQIRDGADPVSAYLREHLSKDTKAALADPNADRVKLYDSLRADLNRALQRDEFYDEQRFAGITLAPDVQQIIAERKQAENLPPGQTDSEQPIRDAQGEYLNRRLIEAAYPNAFTPVGGQGHILSTRMYSHLFDGIYQKMDAAMFSIISFFILSAAYRAFRIRNVESSILMASALIVLLGLSFGVMLTQWLPDTGLLANLRLENWSNWVLSTLSIPALRAIDFGVGLGGLAMGLRIWLGIERGALFAD